MCCPIKFPIWKAMGSDLKTDVSWLDLSAICIEALLWGRGQVNWVGLRTDKVASVSVRLLEISPSLVILVSLKVLVKRRGNVLS